MLQAHRADQAAAADMAVGAVQALQVKVLLAVQVHLHPKAVVVVERVPQALQLEEMVALDCSHQLQVLLFIILAAVAVLAQILILQTVVLVVSELGQK